MDKVVQFLKDCKTFYIATMDGDQPRVRPFGAVMKYDDKLYICTNNTKNCFKQMIKNPKVEITGVIDDKWIRLTGEVAVDDRIEVKERFLKECPLPMYKADDGVFEILYFTHAHVSFCSFTDETIEIEI